LAATAGSTDSDCDVELTNSVASEPASSADQARRQLEAWGFTLHERPVTKYWVTRDAAGNALTCDPVDAGMGWYFSRADLDGRRLYCGTGKEWSPHDSRIAVFERLIDCVMIAREEYARLQADREYEAQRNGRTT
jgi:hypothetical protein